MNVESFLEGDDDDDDNNDGDNESVENVDIGDGDDENIDEGDDGDVISLRPLSPVAPAPHKESWVDSPTFMCSTILYVLRCSTIAYVRSTISFVPN